MTTVEALTDEELWQQVQNLLEQFGEGHESLSKCRLIRAGKAFCDLYVPQDFAEIAQDRRDAIEDALEQVLGEHHVRVCFEYTQPSYYTFGLFEKETGSQAN